MQCQTSSRQTRPYQGVRVKDPVKELLRKKRSLNNAGKEVTTVNKPSHSQVAFPAQVTGGKMPEDDFKLQLPSATVELQPTLKHWSSAGVVLQDPSTQTATYITAHSLASDHCMQTLYPSYNMLTYTPLPTSLRTLPVGPDTSSVSQTQCSDTGLTIIPWAQSYTTLSTMFSPTDPLITSSAACTAPPLCDRVLTLPLSTQLQMTYQINPDPPLSLEEEAEVKPPLNLLDELLEDPNKEGELDDGECPFFL